jgi:PadR family transcriptional regulator PadR
MGPSKATAKILRAFLEDPDAEQYGFGLMAATGVKSGSLYPILDRLQRLGWVESKDEQIDERMVGRPKRRLYLLTDKGRNEALKALIEFYGDLDERPTWLPGLEGA